MKILVIDDDRMTVSLLEQLLQRHGYGRVLGITDSRVAVETCQTFDPDLILLDVTMPVMALLITPLYSRQMYCWAALPHR